MRGIVRLWVTYTSAYTPPSPERPAEQSQMVQNNVSGSRSEDPPSGDDTSDTPPGSPRSEGFTPFDLKQFDVVPYAAPLTFGQAVPPVARSGRSGAAPRGTPRDDRREPDMGDEEDEDGASRERSDARRQFDEVERQKTYDDNESQLDTDARIVEILRADGAAGRRYEGYVSNLLRQCYPVVMAWLRSGMFFVKSAMVHRAVVGPTQALPHDELEDLVLEILNAGHDLFRKQGILNGRWTRSKGACLKTYYLNACIREFANVFRKWQRHRKFWQTLTIAPELAEIADTTTDEDSGYATDHISVLRELLAVLDETHRVIVYWYYGWGYTQAEIGSFLGKTRRSVEHIVANASQELKDAAVQLGLDESRDADTDSRDS